MTLVDGLQDGRWMLATKTHHAMVDGVGSVDIGHILLDGEPRPAHREAPEDAGSEGALDRRSRLPGWLPSALSAAHDAHTTCPGVRLMRDLDSYGMGWGSLTPIGQFALARRSDNRVFLERCGTSLRRLLGDGSRASYAVASNAGAIVWQAVTSQLDGLMLPSLQFFTIPLPSAIAKPSGSPQDTPIGDLELTSDALYVTDGWSGTPWQTASPTASPLNTSRPSIRRSGNTLTCRRGSWRNAVAFSYAWRVMAP